MFAVAVVAEFAVEFVPGLARLFAEPAGLPVAPPEQLVAPAELLVGLSGSPVGLAELSAAADLFDETPARLLPK